MAQVEMLGGPHSNFVNGTKNILGSAYSGDANLIRHKKATTLKNLGWLIRENTRDGTSTLTYRLNGTTTGVAISIPASGTGVFEVDDTISVSIDDLSDVATALGGTSGTLLLAGARVTFENDDGIFWMPQTSGNFYTDQIGTFYANIQGTGSNVSNESLVQIEIGKAHTIRNLRCNLQTAPPEVISLRTRINGANGNITLHLNSGTGIYENTTASDLVSEGDLVALSYGRSSTNQARVEAITFEWEPSEPEEGVPYIMSIGFGTPMQATARYHNLFGPFTMNRSVAVDQAIPCKTELTLSRMRVRVSENDGSTGSVRLMVDGEETDMVVNIGSGTTGQFENDSAIVEIPVGARPEWRSIRDTGTNLRLMLISAIGFSSLEAAGGIRYPITEEGMLYRNDG